MGNNENWGMADEKNKTIKVVCKTARQANSQKSHNGFLRWSISSVLRYT